MADAVDLIGGPDEGDVALACTVALVDELVRAGMRHACVSPGSRSTPIALALARQPEVTLHVHLDERSSAFFALGIAKATGDLVAVACTSGTAAAEFFPVVVEASQSRTPLVLLTADRPAALRGTGANQTIDQDHLYGDYVRIYVELPLPDRHVGTAFRDAGAAVSRACFGDPPGPAHVNLGFRENLTPAGLDISVADPGNSRVEAGSSPGGPTASGGAEHAVTIIQGARRGVVLLGGRGPMGSAAQERALAERLGWPVVAEPTSAGWSEAIAMSAGSLLLADAAWIDAHAPDVVVQIGATPLARGARALTAAAEHSVIVPCGHLDPAPGANPSSRVGDIDALLARIDATRTPSEWLTTWRTADALCRSAVDELLDSWNEPFEGRIARDTAAAIDGGTLVAASSMPIRDLATYAAPRDDVRVLANRGASGIDGFIATVLGVAAAEEGRSVFALCGDLSFLYDLGTLAWSGRRDDLNATFVVPNNDGGAIFSLLEQAALPEFERLFATPHGLDLGAICAAVGVHHERVEAAEGLDPALERSDTTGVSVVEAVVDRSTAAGLRAEVSAMVEQRLPGF
ncbi:MAG: 2-succinyl-5-enolpyruvyl-6-hydroxy-3-cyclohexene-1-carboxylic-acid synthase [Actinomycetota bacterium]